MMPKFRKKPIEIEAIQLTCKNWDEVCEFMGSRGGEIRGGWVDFLGGFTERDTPPPHLSLDDARIGCVVITTHGEEAIVRQDDWIIPDSRPGTFYPCKPDIFEATYDEVIMEFDARTDAIKDHRGG